MKNELLKEVWKLRFEKMLRLEKEAVRIYEKFFDEHRRVLAESGAEPLVTEVIADEKKHVRLAEELVKLADQIWIPEGANEAE